jgi:hypothetical protein
LTTLITEEPFKPFFGEASDGDLEKKMKNEKGFQQRINSEAAKTMIKSAGKAVIARI